MKGIEFARLIYENYGRQMLHSLFSCVEGRAAVGVSGRGSDAFGFDDAVSQDHDFAPGFCIWLTEDDFNTFGREMNLAYGRMLDALPDNFRVEARHSEFGTMEHGVQSIPAFFKNHTGIPGAPTCWQDWLYTPDYAFAEVTNGIVFRDDLGVFSNIRNVIRNGMPRDVLLKKIAARAVVMGQAGQYNFMRCHKHGEPAAAQIALSEFVQKAISLIFLLNGKFAPYYKWSFRALRRLPENNMSEVLSFLLLENASADMKASLIDDICQSLIRKIAERVRAPLYGKYMEDAAIQLIAAIETPEIKALHIMEG